MAVVCFKGSLYSLLMLGQRWFARERSNTNRCLFANPAVTAQHYHSFGRVSVHLLNNYPVSTVI